MIQKGVFVSMRQYKLFWLFSLLTGLALVVSACAGDGEPVDEPEEGEEAEEAGGDLTIALGADVVSLSTHGSNDVPSSNVQENIYETLTVLDADQEVQPGLAKEWEEVDETTWDFHLEEGVKFHDGEELNAEVVKMNFDRLVDEDVASPRAFLFDQVESVEVVDDYTVRLNLEYAFAPLLANLAHTGTGIMSPAIIEEDYAQMEDDGDPDAYINLNLAGTGPFKYEDWTRCE